MMSDEHGSFLYSQKNFPIFQNLLFDSEREAKACPTGDIRLLEDSKTGLVYNAAFDPQRMDYDGGYQNEQAHSPMFQDHLEEVSDIIRRTLGKTNLVEVGCGKGYFLEMLSKNGFSITGFDPAYEGDNPCIKKQYFQHDTGMRADGLILRHVLEHIKIL